MMEGDGIYELMRKSNVLRQEEIKEEIGIILLRADSLLGTLSEDKVETS